MMVDIPGLISIGDEVGPDGETRIIFELEDDKAAQFFDALGLLPGDVEGLRRIVIESIDRAIQQEEVKDEG